MKDVLKMARFDLITASSLTVPYVLAFVGFSFVLALFGIPLGVFCFAAPMALFGPAREAASGLEQRKIYGILPVRKSAVTRAAFWENTAMLMVGEGLSLLFLLISDRTELYSVFPNSVAELIVDLKSGNNLSLGGLCVTIALLSAYLGILSAYLEMESEIHGHESDTKNIIIALSATGLIILAAVALVKKGVLPPFGEWLEPKTVSGKWLFAVTANIAAVVVCGLLCERTVAKTADAEI